MQEMAHPFFCFPDGVQVLAQPARPPLEPQTRSFIMRGESFGVCLYFHRQGGCGPDEAACLLACLLGGGRS